jgi:S1-C subfamily serine protease
MIAKDVDIPGIVRQAKPAVVEIIAIDQQHETLKTGTGFFISADGDLLTNYHVIAGASSILAKTPSGSSYFLKGIVSVSPKTDVALLRFYATDVPHLSLGSTTDAVEGQRVLVIGNPEGLQGTVSEGIISAFRENRSLIQITAPISHGSSGSPVLDESGQVLGIAKGGLQEGQNLNFAISSEAIRDAIAQSAEVVANTSDSAKKPAPTATPTITAAPHRTAMVIKGKWPDGRKLLHPDRFVRTRVVDVLWNNTLKLRSGPGASFAIIAELPGTEGSITAFGYDEIQAGNTWWCPVEWKGLRGYVEERYLWKTH